jgi:type I restriction enzyme S subunit
MTSSGKRLLATERTLTPLGLANSAARVFPAGTVMYAMYASLGECCIAEVPAATSQAILGIRPSPTLDAEFLYYALSAMKAKVRMLGQQGTQANLNAGMVRDFTILTPSIHEQRAIAGVLSDVDTLIEALDQLVAKKRDLKTAAMQQLLTGQRRLPGFTGAWETKRLGELFTFMRTAHNPRADLSAEGDVGYVHYGDIHTSSSHFIDVGRAALPHIRASLVAGATFLEDGDLIMADASEDYAGIGKCVEVTGTEGQKAVAGLHTFLLRSDRQQLANGFKGYMQHMPSIRSSLVRLATGISVYGVSKNNVKTIEVVIPPPDEQRAIANVLLEMDDELGALEALRDKTRLIKQGMMQELLTGRTRLIEAP